MKNKLTTQDIAEGRRLFDLYKEAGNKLSRDMSEAERDRENSIYMKARGRFYDWLSQHETGIMENLKASN
jgi:hypothetical protein